MSSAVKTTKSKSTLTLADTRPSASRVKEEASDTMADENDDDGAMFFPVASPGKQPKAPKRTPTPRSSGRPTKASIKTYFSPVLQTTTSVDELTPAANSAVPDSLLLAAGPPVVRGKSIALIMFADTGFSVNDDALTILNALDGPIAVVTVAGLYRTGKSFLLNRVVLDQACAFTVGPTTRACTKGIWMWSEPIVMTNPATGTPINILVIDTEGIGAPTADATHDTRIFALGLLLSSYFIYNSVGSIDEQALSQMSLVTNLSKKLRSSATSDSSNVSVVTTARPSRQQNATVTSPLDRGCSSDTTVDSKSDSDPDSDSDSTLPPVHKPNSRVDDEAGTPGPIAETHSFPGFLWVVRDFALQIRDESGRSIGPREYLEDALGTTASGRGAVAKNRIRKCLRDYFPDRDCFTLVRPCTNEAHLQTLDSLPNSVLRPEFVAQAQELRAKIFTEAVSRPMTVNGCLLTASMLGMLCQSYVRAVNEGKVPDIKDAWAYVCDAQKAKLEQRAVLDFNERVNVLFNAPRVFSTSNATTPCQTPAMFLLACHALRKEVLRVFRKGCVALYGKDDAADKMHVDGDAAPPGTGASGADDSMFDTRFLDAEMNTILTTTSLRFQKQYLQYVQDTVDRITLSASAPNLPALQAQLHAVRDCFLAQFIETSGPSSRNVSKNKLKRLRHDDDVGQTDSETDSWNCDDVAGFTENSGVVAGASDEFVDMVSLMLTSAATPSTDSRNASAPLGALGSSNVWTVARQHYNTNAHLLWGRKAFDLLWLAVSAQYGGMEQELTRLRADHVTVQQQNVALTGHHEAQLQQLEIRHRDEVAKSLLAQKEMGFYFEAELRDKTDSISELQLKLDAAALELLSVTTDTATHVGSLEQDSERERMRAETAEKEVAHLKEEIDELTQEAGVIAEQTRHISEMTLEQNRLRQELAESKRSLAEQKRTLASAETAFKKESKEIHAKLLQSLQTIKETDKLKQAQMRAAKDAAQTRCLTMESELKAMTSELTIVKTQLAESLAAHEQQVHVIRTQMEENELRGSTLLRDSTLKLQESEKQRKEKEKNLDAQQTRFRDERLRLEQEYLQKTKELESRAVNAENQVNEHRRQVEAADERWARKRARTDDSADKSLQLVKVEAELVWQRQNKTDADAQLVDLRRQNHELEQTIRGLERGMDSQMTRAKLEYESKLAALEHRIATLTDA